MLPFYQLNKARPMRNSAMVDREKRLDVTGLPYEVHFNVRGEAWGTLLP